MLNVKSVTCISKSAGHGLIIGCSADTVNSTAGDGYLTTLYYDTGCTGESTAGDVKNTAAGMIDRRRCRGDFTTGDIDLGIILATVGLDTKSAGSGDSTACNIYSIVVPEKETVVTNHLTAIDINYVIVIAGYVEYCRIVGSRLCSDLTAVDINGRSILINKYCIVERVNATAFHSEGTAANVNCVTACTDTRLNYTCLLCRGILKCEDTVGCDCNSHVACSINSLAVKVKSYGQVCGNCNCRGNNDITNDNNCIIILCVCNSLGKRLILAVADLCNKRYFLKTAESSVLVCSEIVIKYKIRVASASLICYAYSRMLTIPVVGAEIKCCSAIVCIAPILYKYCGKSGCTVADSINECVIGNVDSVSYTTGIGTCKNCSAIRIGTGVNVAAPVVAGYVSGGSKVCDSNAALVAYERAVSDVCNELCAIVNIEANVKYRPTTSVVCKFTTVDAKSSISRADNRIGYVVVNELTVFN